LSFIVAGNATHNANPDAYENMKIDGPVVIDPGNNRRQVAIDLAVEMDNSTNGGFHDLLHVAQVVQLATESVGLLA
jgi:hypothetical protein